MAETPHADIPSTPVQIGGVTRHLRFNLRAIHQAERALRAEYGRKVTMEGLFAEAEALSYSDIATLLWAGLLHEQPHLTLDQFLGQLLPRDLIAMTEPLMAAWTEAHGVTEEPAAKTPADPPQSPALLTGAGSGPLEPLNLP